MKLCPQNKEITLKKLYILNHGYKELLYMKKNEIA